MLLDGLLCATVGASLISSEAHMLLGFPQVLRVA